jgi:taurine--2-oxoglutarate transaminase
MRARTCVDAILQKHEDRDLSPQEIRDILKTRSLLTWGPSHATDPLQVARGDGVYFIATDGKRYLDFNSQAMCSALGHTVPKSVIDAVKVLTLCLCLLCRVVHGARLV